MAKTKIIISGYPKSGNTWITRLVAELVKCPVTGFWRPPRRHRDIAIEGQDRKSEFECYKSHHTYDTLKKDSQQDNLRLIHVIRDPRDIAISGASYFELEKPNIKKIKRHLLQISPGGGKLYYILIQSLKALNISYQLDAAERLEKMVETVLYGNRETNPFCALSWEEHTLPYLNNNNFFLRYEDMLDCPDFQCSRILEFLELERVVGHLLSKLEYNV